MATRGSSNELSVICGNKLGCPRVVATPRSSCNGRPGLPPTTNCERLWIRTYEDCPRVAMRSLEPRRFWVTGLNSTYWQEWCNLAQVSSPKHWTKRPAREF